MLVIPIDYKLERPTRILCHLRTKKVIENGGYEGSYKESYKEVWDNLMTEKQKQGYSFERIYNYMINS